MYHCAVRVWLPDEAGALGAVATRIGVAGGDVLAIDVLERSAGRVIDEFRITLPRPADVETLRREVSSVGGVEIEEIREVAADAHESALSALEHVLGLLAAPDALTFMREVVRDLVERTHSDGGVIVAADGSVLVLEGEEPLTPDEDTPSSGLCTASLPSVDATVILHRSSTPYRDRELRRVVAVVSVVDARLSGAFGLVDETV